MVRRLRKLPASVRADLLRVLTSPSNVRADVVRQFHERGDAAMVEVLAAGAPDPLHYLQKCGRVRIEEAMLRFSQREADQVSGDGDIFFSHGTSWVTSAN